MIIFRPQRACIKNRLPLPPCPWWSGARRAESCASSGAAGGTGAVVDDGVGCGTDVVDVAAGVARGSTPIGARMCAKATAMKASAGAIANCCC